MKKSEAEKIIADFLADFEPTEFQEETEDAASGLLHSLLQAGMLPPERTYKEWTGMGSEYTTDNTWKPENEA